jgi:hypothetical protein
VKCNSSDERASVLLNQLDAKPEWRRFQRDMATKHSGGGCIVVADNHRDMASKHGGGGTVSGGGIGSCRGGGDGGDDESKAVAATIPTPSAKATVATPELPVVNASPSPAPTSSPAFASLVSLLVSPMQRCIRYRLIFQQLLRYTERDSDDCTYIISFHFVLHLIRRATPCNVVVAAPY